MRNTALIILPGGGTVLKTFPGRPPTALTVARPSQLEFRAPRRSPEEFLKLLDPDEVHLLRTLEEPWVYYDPAEW